LVALRADIEDRDIALVFSDTSNVMASVADPDTIARLERRWADVVSRAATTARAHAAWNICVYEIETLRTLPDPIATTLDLMRSHDVTWSSHRSEVTSGAAGVQHVLERLRPAGTPPLDWQATARDLTAGICPAA
jgi:hypothetical protein